MNEQPMNAVEAQDHLQMVDRILSRVEQPACLNGAPYIIWGAVGGVTDIVTQMVVIQNGTPSLFWVAVALMAAAAAFMVYFGIRMSRKERRGLLDRHISVVFTISWMVSLVVMLFANHIFAYWSQAAIWSLMFGAAMMYCGSLARSRVSFAGGVLLILSILVANFTPHYAGYVLAAGFIVGMGGAGLTLSLARGE